MASNYWIKLYHEMLDDPKVGRLSDSQYRLMINLFLLAGDCEQDGYLPEKEDIRWRLRNPGNFDDDIEALLTYKIIELEDGELVVGKFAERQGARSATERQQRRRDRLRKMNYYGHEPVTNCETDVDVDVDKEVDIDKEVDVDDNSSPVSLIKTFENVSGMKAGKNANTLAQELISQGVTNGDIIGGVQFLKNSPAHKLASFKSVCTSAVIEKDKRTKGNGYKTDYRSYLEEA
jgi:hypothetical protein